MDNKQRLQFWHLNNQLLQKLDWQVVYFLNKDEENFQVTKYDILGTIDKLQQLVDKESDISYLAQTLFG